MYKVLIISPDTNLDTKTEIVNIASGVIPHILTGTVTREHALDEIASGKYDIVHFATHGKEHVLQMSDGVIEEDMLEHAVRKACGVKVLFLNACKSAHTTVEVYNHTDVNFSIGWPGNVPDQVALQWGKLFYEALRIDPRDVKKATEVANDTILKSYYLNPDELPLVLNGRVVKLIREYEALQHEMRRQSTGIVRVPYWIVAITIAMVSFVLILLLLAMIRLP